VWPVSRPKRFEIKQIKCPLTNGGAPSAIISQHSGTDGPLLPVLQALQETFGCVPEAAVVMVAEALNLSRAEVHGVVTFYHDFRREPAGRHAQVSKQGDHKGRPYIVRVQERAGRPRSAQPSRQPNELLCRPDHGHCRP
jgi:Thioredoxin-like [2Fe-2S] ferredoxin